MVSPLKTVVRGTPPVKVNEEPSKTATEAPITENTCPSKTTTFVGSDAGGVRVTSANPTPPGPIEMFSLFTTMVCCGAPAPMANVLPPTTATPFPTATVTPSTTVGVGCSMKTPPPPVAVGIEITVPGPMT